MACMRVIRIDTQVRWSVVQARGGNWVAVCDPLKLTVQSDTWANLMEDIAQTLDALLKDLLSSNELETFLRERGWVAIGQIPRKPKDVRFDVPFIPALMGPHAFIACYSKPSAQSS